MRRPVSASSRRAPPDRLERRPGGGVRVRVPAFAPAERQGRDAPLLHVVRQQLGEQSREAERVRAALRVPHDG